MHKAVCPGSFDPPTRGHLDIVSRAAAMFDEVVVAVLVNERKVGLFTPPERLDLLRNALAHLGNVTVDSFSGLLVDYCVDHQVDVIVKGLRAGADFDYELQMAQMNKSLAGVDTAFVLTSPEWSFVSSSLVKEVARYGGDIAAYVPPDVAAAVAQRLAAPTPANAAESR